MEQNLHIAIAGCGIGGLAAATLLARQGHQVIIFDQFLTPAFVGSGLIIQPVGQSILTSIGVFDDALDKGAVLSEMIGHDNDRGRRVLNVRYSQNNNSRFGLGIHRATLFELLYKSALQAGATIIPDSKITGTKLNKNKRQLEINSSIEATLFDLVIDSSGASSVISPLIRKPLNYGAIWGTVDWPGETELRYNFLSQKYRKASNMIGVLPIGTLPKNERPKAAIFWSLQQQDFQKWQSAPLDKWKAELINLWPNIEPFLTNIHSHNDMTLASYSHGTLKIPFQEKLAFIGDSAHCASPQLGQGANMALLDAFALSEFIRYSPVDIALNSYSQSRRNHVWLYQLISWAFTPMYQSNSRILPFLRNWIMAPASYIPPVPRILSKLVCGDIIKPIK